MGSRTGKTNLLIALVVVVYAIHLVFNGLAGAGNYRGLFPNTTAEVSKEFHLEITPTGATFSIWGVIFAYQLIWLVYAVTTIFRNTESSNILSKKFYFFFMVNIIFMTIWLFVWARSNGVLSFIVIVTGQLFLDLTIGFGCCDLHTFLENHEVTSSSKVDVWCQRLLVQNGVLFYASWTTVASLINTAVVFAYELGATTETASIIVLSFLTVIVITWFVLENFVFSKVTDYTFTAYIALIWALSGIFASILGKNTKVGGFVLGLLVITIILFVVRVVLIALRSIKRESYETIGYDAKKETVKA